MLYKYLKKRKYFNSIQIADILIKILIYTKKIIYKYYNFKISCIYIYYCISQYIRPSKYVHNALIFRCSVLCVNYIISTNERRALITLTCLVHIFDSVVILIVILF